MHIREFNPLPLLERSGHEPLPEVHPATWEEYCSERGVFAFGLVDDNDCESIVVAESLPRGVHILFAWCSEFAFAVLLRRVVQRAGERNVTFNCPTANRGYIW